MSTATREELVRQLTRSLAENPISAGCIVDAVQGAERQFQEARQALKEAPKGSGEAEEAAMMKVKKREAFLALALLWDELTGEAWPGSSDGF